LGGGSDAGGPARAVLDAAGPVSVCFHWDARNPVRLTILEHASMPTCRYLLAGLRRSADGSHGELRRRPV